MQDETQATSVNLIESFNKSARAYRSGRLPALALVAKYLALRQFKATTNPEREGLTHALFDAVIGRMQDITQPRALPFGIEFTMAESILPVFRILSDKQAIEFVPKTVPDALADIAIAAADALAAFDKKYFENQEIASVAAVRTRHYYKEMTEIATYAQDYAVQFRSKLQGGKP